LDDGRYINVVRSYFDGIHAALKSEVVAGGGA